MSSMTKRALFENWRTPYPCLNRPLPPGDLAWSFDKARSASSERAQDKPFDIRAQDRETLRRRDLEGMVGGGEGWQGQTPIKGNEV